MTGCVGFKKSGNSQEASAETMAFTAIFLDANKQRLAGNHQAAIELYEKCLKIDKKSAAAHYDLSGVYFRTQNLNEATRHSRIANELEPENKWYTIRYLNVLKSVNDFEPYQEVLKKAIKQFPNEDTFITDLIDNYILTEKFSEAIKELDRLENKLGTKEYTSVQKAQLYLELGDFPKAERELYKLLESAYVPANLLHLASFYRDINRDEQSLEYYQKVIDLDTSNPEANFALYEYYAERSMKIKAIKYLFVAFSSESFDIDRKVKLIFSFYESSLKDSALNEQVYKLMDVLERTHSSDPKVYAVYGDFLFRDQKLEASRGKFLKSLSIDQNRYPIWKQVVLIDNQLGDFSSMIIDCEEAISFYPSQPELYWFKGVAEYQLKDYDDAINSLEVGLAFLVDNPVFEAQFYSLKGSIFNEQGKYVLSDQAFDKAIELDGRNALVLNNYAYYLSVRNTQLEKAEELIQKAIQLNPNDINYLDTYGWILFKSEMYDEAFKVLMKSYDLGGKNNPTILEHIAEVYLKLGDQDKAIEFYHNSIDKGGDQSTLFEKIIKESSLIED